MVNYIGSSFIGGERGGVGVKGSIFDPPIYFDGEHTNLKLD